MRAFASEESVHVTDDKETRQLAGRGDGARAASRDPAVVIGGRLMSSFWMRTLALPDGHPFGHRLSSRPLSTCSGAQDRGSSWRRRFLCRPHGEGGKDPAFAGGRCRRSREEGLRTQLRKRYVSMSRGDSSHGEEELADNPCWL